MAKEVADEEALELEKLSLSAPAPTSPVPKEPKLRSPLARAMAKEVAEEEALELQSLSLSAPAPVEVVNILSPHRLSRLQTQIRETVSLPSLTAKPLPEIEVPAKQTRPQDPEGKADAEKLTQPIEQATKKSTIFAQAWNEEDDDTEEDEVQEEDQDEEEEQEQEQEPEQEQQLPPQPEQREPEQQEQHPEQQEPNQEKQESEREQEQQKEQHEDQDDGPQVEASYNSPVPTEPKLRSPLARAMAKEVADEEALELEKLSLSAPAPTSPVPKEPKLRSPLARAMAKEVAEEEALELQSLSLSAPAPVEVVNILSPHRLSRLQTQIRETVSLPSLTAKPLPEIEVSSLKCGAKTTGKQQNSETTTAVTASASPVRVAAISKPPTSARLLSLQQQIKNQTNNSTSPQHLTHLRQQIRQIQS